MSEKENPDIPAADPADNRTDTRRRGLGVRWDDRRRRPGERRARKERRDDEDRRKSERRLRVADRRVIDGSFSSPDRRSGEDRRKYDDRRYLQRRGEDRRKIPDRRKQKENPGQESGAADKAPGGSSPSPD